MILTCVRAVGERLKLFRSHSTLNRDFSFRVFSHGKNKHLIILYYFDLLDFDFSDYYLMNELYSR